MSCLSDAPYSQCVFQFPFSLEISGLCLIASASHRSTQTCNGRPVFVKATRLQRRIRLSNFSPTFLDLRFVPAMSDYSGSVYDRWSPTLRRSPFFIGLSIFDHSCMLLPLKEAPLHGSTKVHEPTGGPFRKLNLLVAFDTPARSPMGHARLGRQSLRPHQVLSDIDKDHGACITFVYVLGVSSNA